jgi:integrase
MKDAKLSAKTIQSYMGIVKSVVASVIDEETGEPVFNRKWNASVLDTPVIENQKTPCFTPEEITDLTCLPGWEGILYTILAATGLRIGEALALETKHVINGGRTLRIEQAVNRFGKIAPTKTKAGVREVDLHPDVTDTLLRYVRGKKGLLFPSKENTPQLSNTIFKRKLMKHTEKGFHAFRRFRVTHLREQLCQHDIEIYWLGHKPSSMSELYSKLARMLPARLKEVERVGLGYREQQWYENEE